MLKEAEKSMYNILYIDNTTFVGGALVSLSYILRNVNKENYCVHCALAWKGDFIENRFPKCPLIMAKHTFSENASKLDKRVFKTLKNLPGRFGKKTGDYLFTIYKILFEVIPYTIKVYFFTQRYHIHLIHLNNDILNNIGGILVAKLIKVPCILHTRGFVYNSLIMRKTAKWVDMYIAISEAVKKSLVEIGVPESKIRVINNALDLNEYNFDKDYCGLKRKFGLDEKIFSVGIIGNVLRWKGQDIFIKAIAEVVKEIPNCYGFIVGGWDSEEGIEFKQELISLCESLNILEHIIFTGYRPDIISVIRDLDIIVNASSLPNEPEPFGRTIIEAMAMKKPVIVPRKGGPLEIVEEGVNGLFFTPGDYLELAQSIIKLLKDSDTRRKMGEEGRKTVERKYNVKQQIKLIEEVYVELLDNKLLQEI